MTLILKLDLDIVKIDHHTKNEVSMSTGSKVIARTDIHTDRHTDTMKTLTLPHTREVKITCPIRMGGNYWCFSIVIVLEFLATIHLACYTTRPNTDWQDTDSAMPKFTQTCT